MWPSAGPHCHSGGPGGPLVPPPGRVVGPSLLVRPWSGPVGGLRLTMAQRAPMSPEDHRPRSETPVAILRARCGPLSAAPARRKVATLGDREIRLNDEGRVVGVPNTNHPHRGATRKATHGLAEHQNLARSDQESRQSLHRQSSDWSHPSPASQLSRSDAPRVDTTSRPLHAMSSNVGFGAVSSTSPPA